MTAWQEFFKELPKSQETKVYGIWFHSRTSIRLTSTTVSGAQRTIWVPPSSVYIGNNKSLWMSMTTNGETGSWSFSHIRLALIMAWSCTEAKVERSKVKVKSGSENTLLMGPKSRTESRILTILALFVNINQVVILVKCQGYEVKGQGHIRPQPIDLITFWRNPAVTSALAVSWPKLVTFSYRQELKLVKCKKKNWFLPPRSALGATRTFNACCTCRSNLTALARKFLNILLFCNLLKKNHPQKQIWNMFFNENW